MEEVFVYDHNFLKTINVSLFILQVIILNM